MSYALRIEFANTGTETLDIVEADTVGDSSLPSLRTLSLTERVIRQPEQSDEASVSVYRGPWSDLEPDVDRTDDKVFVEDPQGNDIFGGRFRDWEYNGPTVSLLLDGPKVDAVDAEPSGGNDIYQPQADTNILTNELLPRVSTITAGTTNSQNGSIAFSEQHASPGKSITTLARDADAEVRYNADFTLDYVARIGTDKTGTTLSPDSAEVIGEPRKQTQIKENVTHVRVLGAGSGTQQVQAEAVASSYSSGDRQVWRKYKDKDIQDQSRAQELANTLAAEYDGAPEKIEIEVELAPAVAPAIGDSFTLDLPKLGINGTFRIMELERIIDEAGERFRALFSNRRLTREKRGEQNARSVESFNSGNAGQYYALSDGEGWDAVASGENYEFTFYRPSNTIDEYRAQLRLESREYRLRADQVGHNHSVTVPDHNHSFSVSDTATSGLVDLQNSSSLADVHFYNNTITEGQTVWDGTHTVNHDAQLLFVSVSLSIWDSNRSSGTVNIRPKLRNPALANTLQEFEYEPILGGGDYSNLSGSSIPVVFVLTDVLDGTTIEFGVQHTSSADSGATIDVNGRIEIVNYGDHKHTVSIGDTSTTSDGGGTTATTDNTAAVDPGINTISGEQVSNVSADVNGTTVASGLSAPVDTTVDIDGELADGANPVTISSDSLGELRATVEYEALKNADK